jgi:nucleotide-binding universal stress UspA family protein
MKRLSAEGDLFRTVLCPVDFSAHSKAALQHAAGVAGRSGGRLSVLFVIDPLLAAAAAGPDQRALAKKTDAELRDFVEKAIGPKSGGAAVRLLAQGDPAVEIDKAVRRTSADLIVMGSQGLSGASRMFFGSITEQVLRRATVPVFAVASKGKPAGNAANASRAPILAALDLGRHAAHDARNAAHVARWYQANLILVHVVKPTSAPHWLRTSLHDRDRVAVDEARTRLEQIADGLGLDREIGCQVRLGDAAEQVAAVAADVRAAFVVMTLRARHGFFVTPQGTTTYRVLGGTGTAVLAIPSRWRTGRSRTAR